MKRYLIPIPATIGFTGLALSFAYAIFYDSISDIKAPGGCLLMLVFAGAVMAIVIYSLTIDDKKSTEDVEAIYYEEEVELPHADRYYPMARNSIIRINNEMGVVAAFASVCNGMGYIIEEIQVKFPDAVVREIATGRLLSVEFEYMSSNFKKHGHDENECDLIVCWKHDYQNCPLPVLEMSEKW